MSYSILEILFPIALGLIFGAYRYTAYLRSDPSHARQRAVRDALLGAAGMTVVTFVLKLMP